MIRHHLICIAQEAVLNAVKHSGADRIEISLHCTKREIYLQISDNGRGMISSDTPARDEHHYGITGMKERAAQLGGDFRFTSRPGVGTTISVRCHTGSSSIDGARGVKLGVAH